MSTEKPRIRRTPEAARENILAAAESLLVEQGPQALKLADVAEAAGVSNAAVLHHFGSIGEVQAALMERMIGQLVESVLEAGDEGGDLAAAREGGIRRLFDTFENRGAARLAAWLELTGESQRLTTVRQAVQQVVVQRMAPAGITPARAENMVLASVVLALGVGLFGETLAGLLGKPPGRSRKLAEDMLRAFMQASETGGR